MSMIHAASMISHSSPGPYANPIGCLGDQHARWTADGNQTSGIARVDSLRDNGVIVSVTARESTTPDRSNETTVRLELDPLALQPARESETDTEASPICWQVRESEPPCLTDCQWASGSNSHDAIASEMQHKRQPQHPHQHQCHAESHTRAQAQARSLPGHQSNEEPHCWCHHAFIGGTASEPQREQTPQNQRHDQPHAPTCASTNAEADVDVAALPARARPPSEEPFHWSPRAFKGGPAPSLAPHGLAVNRASHGANAREPGHLPLPRHEQLHQHGQRVNEEPRAFALVPCDVAVNSASPQERWGHSAVLWDNKVVMFGVSRRAGEQESRRAGEQESRGVGLAARRDGNQMDGLEQGVCAAHRAGGCNSVLHLCGAIMSHAAEVPSSSTRGRPRVVAGGRRALTGAPQCTRRLGLALRVRLRL